MLFKCVLAFQQIQKKQKNPYSLIVLVNYYTIRVFATLTYSTRNQLRSVGTCLLKVIFLTQYNNNNNNNTLNKKNK